MEITEIPGKRHQLVCGVPFHFHQTGARLRRGTTVYEIPREYQHEQARKAHLDFNGISLPAWESIEEPEE